MANKNQNGLIQMLTWSVARQKVTSSGRLKKWISDHCMYLSPLLPYAKLQVCLLMHVEGKMMNLVAIMDKQIQLDMSEARECVLMLEMKLIKIPHFLPFTAIC